MKKNISFIVLLSIIWVGFSQKDPEAKRILDAVGTKYKAYKSFKANITYNLEVTSNPALNESFKADVKVKGNKFHVKKSDGEEYFCNAKYIWNYFDGECTKTDFDAEENPINLTKTLNAYNEGYKYIKLADETLSGVVCHVIDLNPDKSAQEMATSDVFKIRLLINAKTNEVKQWIVFEKNGNRHKFKINTFVPNAPITDPEFSFDSKKYPGVMVEDLSSAN